MNPVVLNFAGIEIRAFTAWIGIGALILASLMVWYARHNRLAVLPYLDCLLGMLAGGLIGARATHVALNWAYFAEHQSEILNLRAGGLDWHGALIGGLIAGTGIALLRRVALRPLLDLIGLAFPLVALAIWQGCIEANAVYGLEVRTLADYPAWLVIESADIYGQIAPRLNIPAIGMLLTAGLFVAVLIATLSRKLMGQRLWITLVIFGLGMAILGFFRADYVPTWLDRRADQILDLASALMAALLGAVARIYQLKHPPGASNSGSSSGEMQIRLKWHEHTVTEE